MQCAFAVFYIVTFGQSACIIFFHIFSNRHDFRGTLLNIKYFLEFVYKFFRNISLSKKNSVSYYHKLYISFCVKPPVILVRCNEN